jgi:predicted helicase
MAGTAPFDQLMASLPRETSTSLGGAFERIVKWFLENDPEYRLLVRRVWLWDRWPGRWGTDIGIDLVVEDHDGKLWAVQAKGYDADASLTYRELSTFFAAATTTFRVGPQDRQFGSCRNQQRTAPAPSDQRQQGLAPNVKPGPIAPLKLNSRCEMRRRCGHWARASFSR